MQSSVVNAPAINQSAKQFRRDIEGLRAIAVIAVVAFHFGVPGIPGGFAGVDVFFVISGYLITSLLLQELEASGRIDLLAFYGRRARRLLPAVLLMTLVTLAAGVFIVSPFEQTRFAWSAAATSLYTSNILFLRSALDYFAPQSASNPFLHTWSLAVEEQFYLVWPALLLVMSRRRVRPLLLATTIAVVTAISFALCVWLTRVDQPWAFYMSPARAWEFGLGGLATFPWTIRWAKRSRILPVVGWIAVGALLVSFALIHEAWSVPGWIMLLPVAATVCLLISGAAPGERGPARILRMAPFQWFGRRSYSLYLWHWPIITLALALYPRLSVTGRILCAALTLICAAASYEWLEDPVRRHPWLAMRSLRSVGLGAGLTAAGVVFALSVGVLAKHLPKSPALRAIKAATTHPYLAMERNCMVPARMSKPKKCVFGDSSSNFTIVLFGDSHAGQWSTPLAPMAQAEGWRLVTYLKSGCSVADVPVYNPHLHRISDECAVWRAKAIAAIVRLHPNLIVASEFSDMYFHGSLSRDHGEGVSLDHWAAGMKRSLNALREAGATIVLLRDTPSPLWDMRSCLENAIWQGRSPHTCDMPRSLALDSKLTLADRELAASIPQVRLVDLTSQFCDETTCPAMLNDKPVYRDSLHISAKYSRKLAAPLRAALFPSAD